MKLTVEYTKQIIDDNERLKHILYCIDEVEVAINGLSFDGFLDNKILQTAVSKWIEVIGESAKCITETMKSKTPDINWDEIINLRNHIIYEYYEIDYHAIWKVAISLKELKAGIEAIKLD